VTDANRDGFPDILAIQSNGLAVKYRGNGAGGFLDQFALGVTPNFSAYDLVLPLGDFDARDGNKTNDIIARKGDTVAIFRGTTAGDWEATPAMSGGVGFGGYDQFVAIRDFNGNNQVDLVLKAPGDLQAASGRLSFCPADGSGWFPANCTNFTGPGWNSVDSIIGTGDMDGNGTADLMAKGKPGTAADGKFYFFSGSGTGGFSPPDGVVLSGVDSSGFNMLVAAGDFDGDGNKDVIARRTSDGALFLCKGNGLGAFSNGCNTMIGSVWGGFREIRGVW
jgi:hypothetical protein